MLYEMVTGEKPFPGQNITTVIYKIVNEDPVPPRQIDPSIHPGISAVIMKALVKEPDQRYQSCREMLEDLHNYRTIAPGAANPQSTMVMGGGSPAATLIPASPAGRGFTNEDNSVAAAARSLNARASTPGQTPVVRRTATIAPAPEPPKKKNVVGTIFAALFLLGVIVYGAIKIRPVFEAARELHDEQKKGAPAPTVVPAATETAPAGAAANTAATETASQPKDSAAVANAETKPAEPKPAEIVPEKPATKKPENTTNPKAAEYKGRIEQVISDKGLTGHVHVQAAGNTLTLAGKLRPAEHGALLKLLRNAPSDVRVIDHLEYDDTPVAATAGSDEGAHPVPPPGQGAIHVVTDVIGAHAVLRGPAGHVLSKCDTPCSFNDLNPARYSLEVQKDGYQPVQTALQVKSGDAQDQKIKLESLAKGVYISSQPPGADVFINGAKQSGQTPVTLPLAPGQYNLVLRLAGYEPYAGGIQVKDNIQTQLNVPLNEKSATRVAWAQVSSTPKGAEIIVDGNSTGQFTPARVQVPTGVHTVTVHLNGFQFAKRTFQASEGGTVPIDVPVQQK